MIVGIKFSVAANFQLYFMTTTTYPIIILPRALSDALQVEPPRPELPTPVVLPAPPKPLRPVSVGKVVVAALFVLFLLVLVVAQLAILAVLLAALAYLGVREVWHDARRRQLDKRRKYKEALDQQRTYPARLVAYQQDMREYGTAAATAVYRARELNKVLAEGALSFRYQPTNYLPKQGRSEAAFADQLRECFGDEHIHTDCGVAVHDPKLGASWFYPDFIYHDDTGLTINIEVDEPYALSDHTPIHYHGQDKARNGYFVRQRWVVVRFTEEQVVRQPELCCKELAQLIFRLNRRHYAVRFLYDSLRPQPSWSRQQAQQFARQQVREKYLGIRRGRVAAADA